MRRVFYPASRAVEHAASLPGVSPLRLFSVLWPLWQVETTAEVYDRQDFELIDHFVVRAIHEGALRSGPELAAFFGLPPGIIERCLAFLRAIGHIADSASSGGRLQLTDLGVRSVTDGIRYVPSTSRLTILIERQTGRPLPRPYYDGAVPVLDAGDLAEGQVPEVARFRRVFTIAPFDPRAVERLAERTDRAEYNLPAQFRNLRQEGVREGFLPTYLVETADHRILAYTALAERRDEFMEEVCTATSVEHLIEAEAAGDPAAIWRKWLAQTGTFGAGRVAQTPGGRWRVILASDAFGEDPKPSLMRIGAYQFWDNHCIQVWCADRATRQRALLERALGVATTSAVTTLDDLRERIRDLARALEVPEVSVADLRRHAQRTRDDRRLSRLDALERGDA